MLTNKCRLQVSNLLLAFVIVVLFSGCVQHQEASDGSKSEGSEKQKNDSLELLHSVLKKIDTIDSKQFLFMKFWSGMTNKEYEALYSYYVSNGEVRMNLSSKRYEYSMQLEDELFSFRFDPYFQKDSLKEIELERVQLMESYQLKPYGKTDTASFIRKCSRLSEYCNNSEQKKILAFYRKKYGSSNKVRSGRASDLVVSKETIFSLWFDPYNSCESTVWYLPDKVIEIRNSITMKRDRHRYLNRSSSELQFDIEITQRIIYFDKIYFDDLEKGIKLNILKQKNLNQEARSKSEKDI